jgi:hypothetical protein
LKNKGIECNDAYRVDKCKYRPLGLLDIIEGNIVNYNKMKKFGVIVIMDDIPDDIRSRKALCKSFLETRNRLITSFSKRL